MPKAMNGLQQKFNEHSNLPCITDFKGTFTYQQLILKIDGWCTDNRVESIKAGQVAILQADFSFLAISLFCTLLKKGVHVCLVSPNAQITAAAKSSQANVTIRVQGDAVLINELNNKPAENELYLSLQTANDVGFVILTSGSTGEPKAVLHSLERFTQKYEAANKRFTTFAFLLLDHIAGVDNLFYTLFAGGHLVCSESRQPGRVTRLIREHSVEVLPTSPSFLNLWLLSGELEKPLPSLKVITYGSEKMPPSTLEAINAQLPGVRFIQKYGSSEFGSPRSKSRGDDSLWIKLEGNGFGTKVIDGILWVKAQSSMVGYLNAESPEIVDGWMNTGDRVEVDGDWIKILGRDSQIINVGGEKVYPSEVEEALMLHPMVIDASVSSIPHPILGQAVIANIQITGSTLSEVKQFKKELRFFLLERLARYKVPVMYSFTDESLVSERQKKIR